MALDKKKRVEALAKDLKFNLQITPNPKEHPSHQLARLLVQDGYCKVSDAARAILEDLENIKEEFISTDELPKACAIRYALMQIEKKYLRGR